MPSDDELRRIYEDTKTIAVVGASGDPSKPAHTIPTYLKKHGFEVIGVNPKGGELFDRPVAQSLEDIDQPIDVVDMFRPAKEAPQIAREAAAVGAKVLWLQAGISSNEAAEIAREAGMQVVVDACMGATHARLGLGPGPDA